MSILEEHCIFGNIIWYYLTVVDQVPYNDTIFERRLRYSNSHSVLVASSSDLLYPGLLFSLVHVDAQSVQLTCRGVQFPGVAFVPEKYVVLIHGLALQVAHIVVFVVEVDEFLGWCVVFFFTG